MGRTGRKRAKYLHQRPQPLDHQENAINLRKFMTRNGFHDPISLKLRNFPDTGRGVATPRSLKASDVLITVPYELMITYTTLKKSNFLHLFAPQSRLSILDLLAAFLVVERGKETSFWKDYIKSLPPQPPWIPALLSQDRVELLPVDLRLAAKKSRRLLEESWSRVRKSIREASCVIDLHSFIWGYVLVNTRAVYVNPRIVRKLCDCQSDILSDEPCMALCPFLDMFNHSHEAKTEAKLINENGKLVYQLTTLGKTKKHEQVFISYGDHDNIKLLVEYGFFIPGNSNDSIPIQSEEVFQVLGLNLDDFQYKFIRSHELDKSLCISEAGVSFNLKAFLFVAFGTTDLKHLTSVIYNDDYPKKFLEHYLVQLCLRLLQFHLKELEKILQNSGLDPHIIDFLEYRKLLIQKLCDLVNKQ
ncbi:SET domain-containing protein 4 [Tribolium madens]|uniref:SET domain-containing protein 4 n=1 Tax=Tribolium madens TaxID=41895 RepID=UPI001CF73B27|nr:SET domain-containing protein 4 [Tribolium madens]